MELLKIRELKVGQKVNLILAVLEAEIKTSVRGPYLLMKLFDGSDQLTANLWSYSSQYVPPKNTVLNISGKVTEWNGNTQLTVDFIEENKEADVSIFAPKGDNPVEFYIARAVDLINSIECEQLRLIVKQIFNDNKDLLNIVPGAKGIHHAHLAGTLAHLVGTATKAKAMAEVTADCSVDLSVAGALLHDIGKLWSYKIDGAAIENTILGDMLEHIPIGIAKLELYRTQENSEYITLLQHVIASHHGRLEWGSPTTPRFVEAWVVHLADMLDSRSETIRELNKGTGPDNVYTKKEWSLENRSMFSRGYIDKIITK